jgi:hypothetical protein
MFRSLAAMVSCQACFTARPAPCSMACVVAGIAAFFCVLMTTGCRSGAREHRGVLRPASEATIGRDLRRWPAGTTLPATGLGVDLVDSKALGSPRATAPIAVPPKTDIGARRARSGAIAADPLALDMHSSD